MKETVDFSKLISNAISGDDSAFEELYQLTHKTAYHTACLFLKKQEDVEDVLQNSYLKAFKKLPEVKNPESFENWIKTIVENECKNYIKKEKRFSLPLIFFKNKVEEHSEEWKQPVPQEYMEREELRKNVSDILDSLSPEVRACIVLFHYEQKSLNEISEMLEIPLGTVKSRLHNGRKQIEKEFNKLRKKDPTLFAVGAIPVILSLLSYQAENTVVSPAIFEGVASCLSTGAGATTAGSAAASATAVSTAATGAAATTAATSVAVKVVAVAVAGSVAIGGTVAVKNQIDKKNEENTTACSINYKTEETCTVAGFVTEIPTSAETTLPIPSSLDETTEASLHNTAEHVITASSATQTTKQTSENQPVEKTTVALTKQSTTQKPTATAKSTTTAPTATPKETTTRRSAAARPTTPQKPTTTAKATTEAKPTTTKPLTTSPENNYGFTGGVITEYTGSDTSVSIPSSVGSNAVTAIGSGAFAGNTKIKSVSLPSSVTQIGQEAFADCSSLTSVSLPSSLELIGIGAFYGCSSLTDVSVPSGTKIISDEAFAQCSSLRTITVPESVTSISDDAFDGCDSLTVRCKENSAAHNFAVENGINYVLI